ncbi:FAD-dependent oxidoreductase [Trebonia kvetii]|uniref:FAD-dependent oxidoreductase n=1 Tax=Trebonia kvetii TaxID=2480626 RepID=A0A6P2C0V6_9ACTN|nr:FAD-dependent oxidoreductase [Trebonia kvetii]TVZ04818.1 FAD-dependent oxidoreductase [Trebonia kvetii]
MERVTGRRIAVIGGGISGLTAGYILSRTDEVTLFEAAVRLGGHADTHLAALSGGRRVPVDTGFIVYNERTYPLLTRLFAELDVATQAAEMSMSVSCSACGVQYAGKRGLAGVGAGLPGGGQRYLRMLADVPRFHRAGRRLLAAGAAGQVPADGPSLGDFLREGGFSAYFTEHFAAPLVAAVWSCPQGLALAYPAGYLFAFLANHGMLSVSGSPQWRTVTGGSRRYVERIAATLARVRLSSPVLSVRRHPDGVTVRDASGAELDFDAVVIATHPDQALRLLDPPTEAERSVLGAFRYTPNQAVLHTDARLLPARAAVRAAWNYTLSCDDGQASVPARVSYYLNRLQGLPPDQDYIVTLGGSRDVDPSRVIAVMDYDHPAYTAESVAAQARLPGLNTSVTAFAGAYHGWGFHEDGCRAGAAAALALGGVW